MLREFQVRLSLKQFVSAMIILTSCTSCMHNPYVHRTVLEEDGTEVEKFFAYGRFCGAHHPILFSESGKIVVPTDLAALPPPIDDLDEACYLHDLCHQSSLTNIDNCDMAFWFVLDSAIEQSPDERCDNLMYDMSAAIKARSTSRSYSVPFGEASSIVANRVWREFTNETDEFPEEGTCNFVPLLFGERSDDTVVETFKRNLELIDLVNQLLDDPDSIDLEKNIFTDD